MRLRSFAFSLLIFLFAAGLACAQVRVQPGNNWLTICGDSWGANNEARSSRYHTAQTCSQVPCGTGINDIPTDGWDSQLQALTGIGYNNYSHGGSASTDVIWRCMTQLDATPYLKQYNAFGLFGRNDISNADNAPAITNGTFVLNETGTFTNGSPTITGISPSIANWLSSSLAGPAGLPFNANVLSTTATTITMQSSVGSANFTGVTGSYPFTITPMGATQFLSYFPHNRKLLILPYYGGATNVSLPDWVRWNRLKWTYRRTHAQWLFELPYCWMTLGAALQDGTEDFSVASQGIPLSESAGTAHDHPGYLATPHFSACFSPVESAMAGKGVYALTRTIPDVPTDIANGATIGQVYGFGNIASWSKVSDDCAGCVAVSSTGLVTKVGGSRLPIVNTVVQATGTDFYGNAATATAPVRILNSVIGAASSVPQGATFALDTDVNYASKQWPRLVSTDTNNLTNSAKFTIVFCIKPTSAAASASNLFIGPFIFNLAGSKIVIQLKDSGAANIFGGNITTATTNYTNSQYRWFFMNVDLSSGGNGSFSIWSGASGTDVDIHGTAALVANSGTLGLAGQLGWFIPTVSGGSSYSGSVKMFYVMPGTSIDFSVAANRRLFEDSSGNPVDLGPTCAIPTGAQPPICLIGAEGDWVTGKNFGSLGDLGYNDNYQEGFTGNSSDPTPGFFFIGFIGARRRRRAANDDRRCEHQYAA